MANNEGSSPIHDEFVDDKRKPCKYGAKCYQKNPLHIAQYKHPPRPDKSVDLSYESKLYNHPNLLIQGKRAVPPAKRFKKDVSPAGGRTKHDATTENDSPSTSFELKKREPTSPNKDAENPDAKISDASSPESPPKRKSPPKKLSAEPEASPKRKSPQKKLSDESETLPKQKLPQKKLFNVRESCSPQRKNGGDSSASLPEDQGGQDVSDVDEDEEEMPESPSDVRTNIKQKFLCEMPEDFYSFWEFCKTLSPDNPADAFKKVGLKLVGPYDVLSGSLHITGKRRKQSLFLRHWRYYYDPPEFQTVLKGDDKIQYHIGYFRDEPHAMPVFLASNCAARNGVFTQMAENIFGAVNVYLNNTKKTGNPFIQPMIPKLQNPLREWASEHGFTLETVTPAMKQRNRKSVTKAFHGAGLVVPVQKKTDVGYRDLLETDANLKRILKRLAESKSDEEREAALESLQPVITAANIANDECDFGTSVELGLDFFTFGCEALERSALQLLTTGYTLLGRKEFVKIAQVHLAHRKKGANLNMFP